MVLCDTCYRNKDKIYKCANCKNIMCMDCCHHFGKNMYCKSCFASKIRVTDSVYT